MSNDTPRTRLEPADRRRELLAVAETLAAEGGLASLSTQAVARAAGASKALVFHYFGSVVGLQRAVTTLAVTDLLTAIHPPPGTPAADRPVVVLDAFITAVTARAELWTDIWRGALHDDSETQAILDGARSTLVDRLAQRSPASPDRLLSGDAEAAGRRALLSQGWVALAEKVTSTWLGAQHRATDSPPVHPSHATMTKTELRDLLVTSLHAVLGPLTAHPTCAVPPDSHDAPAT